jgi:tight adherence protein B
MYVTWLVFLALAGGMWWLLRSIYATREHEQALVRMEQETELPGQRLHTFPKRYTWAVPLLSGFAFASAILWWNWRAPYAFAIAALAGVLALLAEEITAAARVARLEQQLVESIDILVNSLRAGTSLQTAIEAARLETRDPFRSELEGILARMRMGEDPRSVIRNLGIRIPLESMRLFTHALMVHWTSGGSLAGTLLMIGRTLRDRIEVSRRVRAQAVESQISVIAVMGVSYGTATIVYFSNPNALREFLLAGAGMWITVGAMLLQAAGIYWIWRLSQVRF